MSDKHTAWLIPCNVNLYDPIGAFAELQVIDWRQQVKMNAGDEVFIYCSRPYQKIMFKTVATKVNIPPEEADRSDEDTFSKKGTHILEGENGPRFGYAKLKLLNCRDTDALQLKNLMKHGLTKAPQGQIRVTDELYDYLISVFR